MKTKRTSFLARAAVTLLLAVLTTATTWADSWPEYITDVVLAGGTESEATSVKNSSTYSGYTWCSTSLNDGTNGDVIYIGYKKGSRANVNGGYITDFIVIDDGGHNPEQSLTFQGKTYYLCPTAGGDYFANQNHGNLTSQCSGGWNIYLYYTKANFDDKRAVNDINIYSVGDINEHKEGAINCYDKNGSLHEAEISLNKGVKNTPYVYMHISTTTKTNRPSVDPVMASGLVYDGSAKQLIATGATLANGTMYYRLGSSGSFTSTVANVKATTRGTYTVYYFASSNDYSNQSEYYQATVTIAKSPNNGVTVSCADIVEGNAPAPQLGGTNLSTGTATYKYSTTQNGTYTSTVPTDIGNYWVKATIAGDGNCNAFTTAAASFRIVGDWALHYSGEPEDPYIISSPEQLDLLAQRVNNGTHYKKKFFKLGDNITYSHTTDWNDATSTENNYTPIGDDVNSNFFYGSFDGNGKTVSGIRIYRGGDTYDDDNAGLFGYIFSSAHIHDVILADTRITGRRFIGGIAGYNYGGTISNCKVKTDVSICNVVKGGFDHGGIAGCSGGLIEGCTSSAKINNVGEMGGKYGSIAGYVNEGVLRNNFAISATVSTAANNELGAIVGFHNYGTFTNNYYFNCIVAGVTSAANVGVNGADCDGARRGVIINKATGVTITPTGTATTYDVSGITAYTGNSGIGFGSWLFAGATETVTLTVAYDMPEGYKFNGFTDGNGNALTAVGDGSYSLTMTGTTVTVKPDLTDLWGIADRRDGSTAAKAYRITTTAGLDLLASKVNSGNDYRSKYFELGADIKYDGTENNYTPIGCDYNAFSGHFDGKGHTIGGININKKGTDDADKFQGIFGRINNGAEVKNVTLTDASITGYHDTGGLVGYNEWGTVENCHALSSVTVLAVQNDALRLGGIVGNNPGIVKGCTSAASVSGTDYVGSIAGVSNGTILDCLVLGGSVSGTSDVGAIAGYNTGFLTNNYHTLHGVGAADGSDRDGARYAFAYSTKPDTFGDATATYGTGTYTGITAYDTNGLEYGGKYYWHDENIMVLEDHGTGNLDLLVANNGATRNVVLNGRTLYKDGKWNTICLPFDVDLTDPACPLYGATYRTMTNASINGTELNLTFAERWNDSKPANTLIAGYPYVIKWDRAADYVDDDAHNIVNPEFSGVKIQIVSGDYWNNDEVGFIGTINALADITTKTIPGYDVLLMDDDNTLRYAGSGASLGAFRAYFLIDPTKVGDGQAGARLTSFNIDFGDGEGIVNGIIDNSSDNKWFLGDVNHSGDVTPADAIMILYHYFGVEQQGFYEEQADMNKSGDISPADAIEALYLYFGAGNNGARAARPTLEDVRNPE